MSETLYIFGLGFMSGVIFMIWIMMKKGIVKVNGIKKPKKDKGKDEE